MSANYEKLKALLRELFQMDQADLDFGLYRIMNAKREEIERFLEHDLLPQVKTELARHTGLDSGAKKAELDEAIENAKKLGFDPDAAPRVMALRDELKHGTDLDALENEVFSQLCNFFRRYYHQGDFLSLRRYKEGVYAIPYEGEEVKLYWANHDQYYIKSTEYLRNYTFKLRDGRRVHFKVVEAEADVDNNKPQTGKERRFSLVEANPVAVENGELFIRFNYKTDARKQAELNTSAVTALLGNTSLTDWLSALGESRPTEKNPQRTLLAKHLDDFTARYAFDYFIHKDLGGFLRRELDFFIKNEIMHLDDVEDEAAPKVQLYLSKIKALRKIAHKVIAFLEQLENFQKKMWLKKKFVVETNYCVTLDRVPVELYPQIIENKDQIGEWKRLFAIQEIERSTVNPGFSEQLSVDFLKANGHLSVDTKYFDAGFKNRLLARFSGLEQNTNGLVIAGDNFHALNLVRARLRNAVQCFYIDPPYNTGSDGFAYKDNYQHASWLSLLADRLSLAQQILHEDGVGLISIDDREAAALHQLLDERTRIQPVATLVWNTEGHTDNQLDIKVNHEYVVVGALDPRTCSIGYVVDPNTPKESNLWKGFAENSITKNGAGNPPSEVVLPEGFPVLVDTLDLPSTEPAPAFYQEAARLGYITRVLTAQHNVTYPIRRDPMTARDRKLIAPCRVFSGWANANKLRQFIAGGFQPLKEIDGEMSFYLSENGVIYYRKEREKARNILSVLRNMGTTEVMRSELEDMGLTFQYPKPKELLSYLLRIGCGENGTVIDFFAGSGTTAQAVLETNRQEKENRRYVLVDSGEHFYSVILPRIRKLVYSKDWKDGKPVSREGCSHLFKYVRLESYEDCLNNLELKRTAAQDDLLTRAKDFREDYTLRYMLDVEARGSASLLNVQKFTDPFSYKLRVSTGTVGETKEVNVDLVETFNWLVGLTVKHMDHIRGVRVVEGTNPQGDRVLILWRNVAEVPNDKLDEWFKTQGYNTRDQEYDLIFVNGDNNLENLRRGDQTWKVRLIEEDFHRLMWECQDV